MPLTLVMLDEEKQNGPVRVHLIKAKASRECGKIECRRTSNDEDSKRKQRSWKVLWSSTALTVYITT